ncbi:MAG: hypothetical protein LC798_13520 [Chloroflexi bacterium]|nr:hypothetical protein [Chloroflexota bacterium]
MSDPELVSRCIPADMVAAFVSWSDSAITQYVQESAEHAASRTPIVVETVGWVVAEHDDRIVLAMDRFPDEGEVRSILVIPRSAIINVAALGNVEFPAKA